MFVSHPMLTHPALTHPGSPRADGSITDQCPWQDQQPTIPYFPATPVGSWGQPCPQHHCWWVWESHDSTQANTPGEEHGVCLIAWGIALKQHLKKHKGAHHCVKPNERVILPICLALISIQQLWRLNYYNDLIAMVGRQGYGTNWLAETKLGVKFVDITALTKFLLPL